MKKKILFMMINMNVGGTERAFLNLLKCLPTEKYQITLLLLQKKGDFYQEIPKHVTIKTMKEFQEIGPLISYNPKEKIKRCIRNRDYNQAISLIYLHLLLKITKDRRILFKKVFKRVPKLADTYDIAVAYAGPMDIISYYIAMRVDAKKKYQYIHFDVEQIGFDTRFAKRIYKFFTKIYAVSDIASDHLKKRLPSLSHMVVTKENDIPFFEINHLALKKDVFSPLKMIRLVTIARLSKEKGPDLAVKIMSQLKNMKQNVIWHWVGDGEWRPYIEQMIADHQLEKSFILEGVKKNPYPYIRQGDIYVQPSRHEGYCLTLAEARALNKPIVTTATSGALTQLSHGKTGLITDINDQSLLNTIIELIENPDLRKTLSKTLQEINSTHSSRDPFEASG